jgi:8-oxo-dGTP pyrophosphatase MutT (NUDIX family)
MFIKIYFDDKPLFLCDEVDDAIEPFMHHDDAVFIDELDTHTIKTMIHEMQLPKVHAGIFRHSDFEALKTAFFKKFTLIQAAGGLVVNKEGLFLLIFRRGKWDLPKGKLDKGEKLEDCAIREIREETGLQQLKIISPLTISYHTYHEGSRFILKESHWFNVVASGTEQLTPQTEEDIVDIKWVAAADLARFIPQAFPSVADILKTRLPE